MNILDILKARKLGYQTLHNTTDMLLAKKVSGGSYEDVTVSGNPIAITGAKGGLAKALTVNMLPIQDLNGYDSPWVGGGGKNKFDNDIIYGDRYNGVYHQGNNYWTCRNLIPILPDTTYTFSGLTNDGQIGFYDENQTYISNVDVSATTTFTTPANAKYLSVYNRVASMENNHQLELGSSATSYAPYSNICPISGRTQTVVKRCGKNLFDKSRITTQTATTTIDYARTNGGLLLKGGITYTLSIGKSISSMGIYGYGGEVETSNRLAYISSSSTLTFTLTDTTLVFIRLYNNTASGGISESDVNTIQLEVGSMATPYEAYTEADTTIQFGQTVYGGTCDVVNGGTSDKFIIFTKRISDGDRPTAIGTTITRYRINVVAHGISASNQSASVCDKAIYDGNYNGEFNHFMLNADSGFIYLFVPNDTPTSTEFTFCCPLATPTTISTPSNEISLLKGNNTLSTSGDNMTVTYKGKGISSLQSGLSMMSPELTDMAEEDD